MDIDDENAPDDHGIFSALKDDEHDEPHVMDDEQDEDEQLLANRSTDSAMDDAERVLTTLQSPTTVGDEESGGAIVMNIDGMDVIVDTDGDGSGSIEVQLADQTTEASGKLQQQPPNEGDSALRARRQLQMLAAAKKQHRKTVEKAQRLSNDRGSVHSELSSPEHQTATGAKILKMEIIKPAGGGPVQLIKSMQNRLSQKIDSIYVTPNKPIVRSDFAGTIEIPKDLIVGTDVELEGDTFVITSVHDDEAHCSADNGSAGAEFQEADSALHDDDLLAILEGNDHDADDAGGEEMAIDDDGTVISPSGKRNVYVVGVETTADNQAVKSSVVLDKDAEMEAALQQMMSLPQKRKGRPCKPKVDGAPAARGSSAAAAAAAAATKSNKELVNSLVQDWSGSESDSSSVPVPTASSAVVQSKKPSASLSKKSTQAVAAVAVLPVAPAPAAFKRSRIIKKKVIWDPDAPETSISYASLVQSNAGANATGAASPANASRGAPRILNKIPASQADNQPHGRRTPPLQAKRRAVAAPTSPSSSSAPQSGAGSAAPTALQHNRKRKVSEVDRLMRDEGAFNMLNALKQESHDRSATDGTDAAAAEDDCEAQRDDDRKSSISPTRQHKHTGDAEQRTITPNPRPVRLKRPQTPAAATSAAVAAASAATAATRKESAAKRPKKSSAAAAAANNSEANTWDYFYANRGEDSLIIRRRSNSSYSSSASTTHRLSIDGPAAAGSSSGGGGAAAAAVGGTKPSPKTAVKSSRGKTSSFEFAKPNAHKSASSTNAPSDATNADSTTILMDIRSKPVVAAAATTTVPETRRSKRSNAATSTSNTASNATEAEVGAAAATEAASLNAKERKIVAKLNTTGVVTTLIKAEKSSTSPSGGREKTEEKKYNEIVLKPVTSAGVGHIVLQPVSGQLSNVFTLQVLSTKNSTHVRLINLTPTHSHCTSAADARSLQSPKPPNPRRQLQSGPDFIGQRIVLQRPQLCDARSAVGRTSATSRRRIIHGSEVSVVNGVLISCTE